MFNILLPNVLKFFSEKIVVVYVESACVWPRIIVNTYETISRSENLLDRENIRTLNDDRSTGNSVKEFVCFYNNRVNGKTKFTGEKEAEQ